MGNRDGDFDGVTNELSVGDLTALTIYMAALERPVSTIELSDLGLFDLAETDRARIMLGQQKFNEIGCASCHMPELPLGSAVFNEPSSTPGFYDVTFPDGSEPATHGLTMETPISFDMANGQPNNRIMLEDGTDSMLGGVPLNAQGHMTLRWYSDFKRHDMGPDLADPSAPGETPAQYWITRSLAGVGSTGPWLHDGRATTLADAILAHGGEAVESREAFAALPDAEMDNLVMFLESLVIHKIETDEEDG